MVNFTNFSSDNFASLVWDESNDGEFCYGYLNQANLDRDANNAPVHAVATLTVAEYAELVRKG